MNKQILTATEIERQPPVSKGSEVYPTKPKTCGALRYAGLSIPWGSPAGVDTDLPFRTGLISDAVIARISTATGRDGAMLPFAIPNKHAIYRCPCCTFFVAIRSRHPRLSRCEKYAKAAETRSRRRALENGGEERRETRQGRACEALQKDDRGQAPGAAVPP